MQVTRTAAIARNRTVTAQDATALKMLAKQAGVAARLLKLLGNEKRLLILCFLAARGEMTVGELVEVAKLSQSALSQHLARLRADGLVTFRRAVADAALQHRRQEGAARAAGAEGHLLRESEVKRRASRGNVSRISAGTGAILVRSC